MNEVDKIKELEIEIKKPKEENKNLKEKYVGKKCYSNECTLLFNNETRELTIFPTMGEVGTLSTTKLYKLLESNDIFPGKIESIIVDKGVIAPQYAAELFANFENCKIMDLSGLDTSQVTNMNRMFRNCKKLTTIDISNFNTSKVLDMSYIFDNCKNLKTVNFGDKCIDLMQYIPNSAKAKINN